MSTCACCWSPTPTSRRGPATCPAELWHGVAAADVVVHAGDWMDVLVSGHSHIPWDTTTPGGLRLLNPGSPTDRRRQPRCTYLTATVVDGALSDVVLHELP